MRSNRTLIRVEWTLCHCSSCCWLSVEVQKPTRISENNYPTFSYLIMEQEYPNYCGNIQIVVNMRETWTSLLNGFRWTFTFRFKFIEMCATVVYLLIESSAMHFHNAFDFKEANFFCFGIRFSHFNLTSGNIRCNFLFAYNSVPITLLTTNISCVYLSEMRAIQVEGSGKKH